MINESNGYHQRPKKDSHTSEKGERRPRQVDQEFQGVISSAISKAVSQYQNLLRHSLELELKRMVQGYENATSGIDKPVSRQVRSRLSELVSGEVRRAFDDTLYSAEQTIADPIWLKAANKHWETRTEQADKTPRRQKPGGVPRQAPVTRSMPGVNGFVEKRTPGSYSPASQSSDDTTPKAVEVPSPSYWIAPDGVQREENAEAQHLQEAHAAQPHVMKIPEDLALQEVEAEEISEAELYAEERAELQPLEVANEVLTGPVEAIEDEGLSEIELYTGEDLEPQVLEENGELLSDPIEAYGYDDSQVEQLLDIESQAQATHDAGMAVVEEQPRLIAPASASFWILPHGEARKDKEILIIEPIVQYALPQPIQEQPEAQQPADVLDEVLIENADILKTIVHDNDEIAYIALEDTESETQVSEQENEAGEDLAQPIADVDDFVESQEEAEPAIVDDFETADWREETIETAVADEIEQAAAVNEDTAEPVAEVQDSEDELAETEAEVQQPLDIEEDVTEAADKHEEAEAEWSDDDDLTEVLEEDDELTDDTNPNTVFEGTVRLNIEAKGCIKEIVHFVRELRQKPELRLLRLVGNNKDGVDIWLGLREPLRLKSILPEIDGVSIVTKPVPHIGSPNERLLAVKLSPLPKPAYEMPRIEEAQGAAEPVAVK